MTEIPTPAPDEIVFGLDTFGDVPRGEDGELVSFGRALRATLQEAIVADELGVDAFAVGEHHREEFAISSPETVLAGIATATKNITLASGVTVLSSDDPVRVFQRFATVDGLSNGRAEVILGRGRSPSPSPCSATTCPTTRSSSTRRSSCSTNFWTNSP